MESSNFWPTLVVRNAHCDRVDELIFQMEDESTSINSTDFLIKSSTIGGHTDTEELFRKCITMQNLYSIRGNEGSLSPLKRSQHLILLMFSRIHEIYQYKYKKITISSIRRKIKWIRFLFHAICNPPP